MSREKPPEVKLTTIKEGSIDPVEPTNPLLERVREMINPKLRRERELRRELIEMWKETMREQYGIEITDEEATTIDAHTEALRHGDIEDLSALRAQLPQLQAFCDREEWLVEGKEYPYIQVNFWNKETTATWKLASNRVTANLRIGQLVTIKGTVYQINGGGYSRVPGTDTKYGTKNAILPGTAGVPIENKSGTIIVLDDFLLPEESK